MEAMEATRAPGRSLGALAELAMRQTNAAGYAIYEWDRERGAFIVVSSHGVPGPEIRHLCDLGIVADGVTSFGLWNAEALVGVVVFVFDLIELSAEAHQTLQRTARIIESLLTQFRIQEVQVQLAARIAQLEAGLADEKIADRVAGLLEHAEVGDDSIETIERHVHTVLGARNLDRVLDELLRDLEQRTEERGLLAQAKTLLQQQGLSEYQAHAQLRMVSRRNRTRVGEVARQVIQELEAQAK